MTASERYFEDYRPGLIVTAGPVIVSEAEILDFARRYDPQPMHTDAASAQAGQFGGLIASGWHTAALTMRLIATEFLSPQSGLASPGIEELRWLKPVRPGDALSLRATVLDARPSRSKPDQGIVRSLVEILNQHGEVVMTLKPVSIIRRRPVAD